MPRLHHEVHNRHINLEREMGKTTKISRVGLPGHARQKSHRAKVKVEIKTKFKSNFNIIYNFRGKFTRVCTTCDKLGLKYRHAFGSASIIFLLNKYS